MPLVRGKRVAGFSNTQDAAAGLTEVVPYPVHDVPGQNGGVYSKADNLQSQVMIDGNLVTGQNPTSSDGAAAAVTGMLSRPSR